MASVRHLKFIEPMKALAAPAPPSSEHWLYEVKFDGFRVLAVKNGRNVELWSRNKKRFDERFPAVARAVARLSIKSCILDGEVCALDKKGRSSFQILQNQIESDHPVIYYVFDLLFEGAWDLRGLPLLERKSRLRMILLKGADPIRLSSFFTGDPRKILARMKSIGTEGAVAKRKDSVYETGRRSGAWVKIKFHRGQEFVIVGYTRPKKSRQYFGALLLGYYRGKSLVFCGHVGTGFTQKLLRELYRKLQPLECPGPVVTKGEGWKTSETRWVKPKLVAQVQFTEWTDEGLLRHPSFQGLREDKDPRDVVRE